MKVNIQGTLTLTSPLHVAAPGDAVCQFPTDRAPSRFRFGGIQDPNRECPAVRTMFTRKPIPADELVESNGDSKPLPFVELPFIPANSIRGRLRRFAADEIFQAIILQEKKITLGTLRGLLCGAVTGQPAGTCSVEDRLASAKHFYLGLFGGGPRLIQSSLSVCDSYPLIEEAAGVVPHNLPLHPIRARDITQARYYRKLEDLADYIRNGSDKVVDNFYAAASEYLAGLEGEQSKRAAERAEKPAGEKTKKTGLKFFGAIEMVIPGVPFSFDLSVDTEFIGLSGLGLLIQSISTFTKTQGLGGLSRVGFGRFDADLNLIANGELPAPLIKNVNGVNTLQETGNSLVEEALQAWAEVAGTLDVNELEHLFRLE
jgi:CRISPR type AFERR-associated protein Csf2